jgi:hypothetical protein
VPDKTNRSGIYSALRAALPIAPVPPGAMVITPFQPRRGCLHDFIKLIKYSSLKSTIFSLRRPVYSSLNVILL